MDARQLRGRVGRRVWRAARGALVASACLACGGPFLAIPGGRLAGPVIEEPVADWSFLADPVLDLETRPEAPYSVTLRARLLDGQLYLDPAEGRRWLDHIRAEPNVRVRLEGNVYRMRAVRVGEPGELAGFDPTRFVYRLDPVPASSGGAGGLR